MCNVYLSICLFVCNRHNIFFVLNVNTIVVNTAQHQPHIILTKIINILDTVFMHISGCQGLAIVNLQYEIYMIL